MSFDLTNKNISDTYQNLLQRTGSEGHLYDLTGNEITNLTIGGTLTAHSYITSESIVNTSSGSTAFGNSADDTHTFIGAITASAPISSSSGLSQFDKIVTNRLRILRPATSIIHSTIIDHATRAAAGDIVFSIPGDISASGDLFTSESIIFDATDVNLYASGRELHIRNGSTTGIKMTLNDSNSYLGIGTTTPTKNLTVEGDISASGKLYVTDDVELDGTLKLGNFVNVSASLAAAVAGGDDLGNHTATQDLNLDSNDITNVGNIGASSLELNTINTSDDFFLLKSGSLNALKVNGQGVLRLGSFTFTPTAVSGGFYYNDTDDEFYLGKK
jgi:hypothetical protein